MSNRAINIVVIIAISVMVVGKLEWLTNSYLLALAQAGGDFDQMIIDIWFGVAFHSLAVIVVPLLLAYLKQTLASFVVLILALSIYILLITGVNTIALVIAGLMIAAVVYAVFTQSINLIRYFRAK